MPESLNFSLLQHIYSKNDKYEQLFNKLAPFENQSNSGLTQRKNEIIELWTLFERINPKIILEIGVAQGGTFAGWCQLACDDALLIGIDRDVNDCWPREGNQINPDIADHCNSMTQFGGGMWALKRRGSHQTIIPINGWTYEKRVMDELLEVLDGKLIDFLFHDASHKYEDAKRDWELFWPLVSPGGVFVMHDIGTCDASEVTKCRLWREIRDNGPQCVTYSYQYADRLNSSLGIGILFKSNE